MSRLTKLEQETIVLFNEQEPDAEVYTHNRTLQRKLSDLCRRYPEEYTLKNDNGAGGITYLVPKKRINVRAPRTMTAAQKEQAIQNLK